MKTRDFFRFGLRCGAALLFAAIASVARAKGDGPARIEVTIAGTELTIESHRPRGCAIAGVLVVFHGVDRDADRYRDDARRLADRSCLAVYAPLFDAGRFPAWRYQLGGLVRDGRLQPSRDWTIRVVPALIERIRERERNPELPVYLFGHSAGAQFLSRVAAYVPLTAARIVLANASSYVTPSQSEKVPYGYRGLPAQSEGDEQMKAYLNLPITIYLGLRDTGARHLTQRSADRRLGTDRLARGTAVFERARATAAAHGWEFRWRLVTVPRAGHSARKMLRARRQAAFAFGLPAQP